ncbi:insulinase like metalloprotease [Cryptosporidium sp. chipmunk genotype I]|uniref:insulinase like metalloprotease n=1 Tax=Cryptosporidium sp. chipmunk genotype I TaxID=1280935 RepID=UPI00351A4AB9|nr:insulinase like metalloprotease [Cryptosporidium sp. chipmunk genotype I]
MNETANIFKEEQGDLNRGKFIEDAIKQNFYFLKSVKVSNVGILELYQHQTGLILAFMKTFASSGPSFINCRLSFTTLPNNNKGIPHALEHVIFNGSKNFPYYDSIDKISNRLCCPYTNAFTVDDLTTFEFECTTEWSLLRMLEVWLDHLFRPALSEESFLTEIVHLDGNAEYHGVVYSEVSSLERNYDEVVATLSKFHILCESPVEKKKIKLQSTWELYDKIIEKCGGSQSNVFSCTGRTTGLENLTLTELKEFHANFYNLDNMLIFIYVNDHLNINNIFGVIERFISEVEPVNDHKDCKKIKISDSQLNQKLFNRKFCFSENLKEQSFPWHLEIPFPSEEEDLSTISFSWRFGVFSNIKEMLSINVLLHHLCVGNDSPLMKELVEENSYCSNVDMLSVCEKDRYHQILLQGVETGKLNKAVGSFKKIISEFHNGERNFDLNELKCKIEGLYYGHLVSLENKTIDTVFQQLSGFINYGIDNMDGLAEFCNLHIILEKLFSEDLEYWKKLFNRAFCLQKVNILEFVPSKKLSKEIIKKFKQDRKERLNKRDKQFFQKCRAKLEESIQTNKKRAITLEILNNFNISFDLNNINLNKAIITTNINYSENKLAEAKGDDIIFKKLDVKNDPELQTMNNCLYFFLENSNTEFVHAQLRINLNENLSSTEKLLSSFLIELLFQTSVRIINPIGPQISERYSKLRESKAFLPDINWFDGEIINYDDFDKLLNTFCIDYYAEFSDGWILDSNTIPNQIKVNWTTPIEYAEFSSILIMSGICGMRLSVERISTIARTVKGTIGELKLSEESLITCVSNSLCYCDQSIFNISNIPNFDYISKRLIKEPKNYLIELERIHSVFIKPFTLGNSDDTSAINTKFSLFIIGKEEVNKMNILKYFCLHKNNKDKNSFNSQIPSPANSNLLPWEILSKLLPLEIGIDFNSNNSKKFIVPEKYGYSIYLQVPSSNTACFVQSINLNTFGNFSPKGSHFYNPDVPALLVLSNYLWDPCSLLFKSIRGSGLAYSGSLDLCMTTGQFSNCVYESTSIGQSLIKTWKIFKEISMDENEVAEEIKKNNKLPNYYESFYKNLDLDEAKRIAAYKFISKHKKFNSWAKQLNFDLNVGISPNFDSFIVKKISKVTVEDIKRVSNKYLRHFLPSTSNTTNSSCIAFCGGENPAIDAMEVLKDYPNFRLSVISYSDFSKQTLKNVEV